LFGGDCGFWGEGERTVKSKDSRVKEVATNKEEVLDASTLFIGFSGSLGSGCTFLAQGVQRMLGDTCHYYRLSDILRQEAKARGIKKLTTSKLQDLGNELRASNVSILAENTLERIKEDALKNGDLYRSDKSVILVDGIRNDGEVRYFRQYPNFYLISAHASRETRKKRLVGDTPEHRFRTEKAFEDADRRDESEDIPRGQQVRLCNYLADVIIDNNKDYPTEARAKRDKYLSDIVHDYVGPIQAVRNREKLPSDRPPSLDETLMTMAYCMSKKSSCLKRKVGAVVAYVEEFTKLQGGDPRKDAGMRFQVVSAGYNDVPLGSPPCVFTDYAKC
jgi:deoxycytidylate deaminase